MTDISKSERLYRILEKLVVPLAVAILIFIANDVANKIAEKQLELAEEAEKNASDLRQTEIELKYIDLFFDRILSDDDKVREAALSLLSFINDQQAVQLAEWVAGNESFDLEFRRTAVEIAEQIKGLRPIDLDISYNHNRFGTEPKDVYRRLRAFEISFDGDDDDDGDGTQDVLMIPHFVTSESRRIEDPALEEGLKRPRKFLVDEELNIEGLAPSATDYRHSGYDRGHLMSPRLARRLGKNAYENAQSMINVAPQVPALNRRAWNELEKRTLEWVEKFGRVWIVAGPVFEDTTPRNWIESRRPIAIPDAFFKIVIKEGSRPDFPDVMAFIYPNTEELLTDFDPGNYLVEVGEIEKKTGLQFFTKLPESSRSLILSRRAAGLWD